MRRRKRKVVLAAYLSIGAMVLQFGQACTIFNSVATAGVASSGILIDDNGFFLGLVNVCGTPNTQFVTNGIPGEINNAEDDLMFGCPVTQIPLNDNNGGGGDGDG